MIMFTHWDGPDNKGVQIDNNTKGTRKRASRRYSAAETVVLSSLLEVIKLENESSTELKTAEEAMFTASRFEALVAGTMEEMMSSKQNLSELKYAENVRIVDHFGDRGTYVGELSHGEPHGVGIIVYDDDRRYEGEWCNGRYQGEGKTTFNGGDSYEGEYSADLMHGEGTYRWRDGRKYTGEFYDDERHGSGVYSWPDGSSYSGAFRHGKMHGFGRHTDNSGSKYEGSYRQGVFHGHGKLTFSSGESYEGEFRLGLRQTS